MNDSGNFWEFMEFSFVCSPKLSMESGECGGAKETTGQKEKPKRHKRRKMTNIYYAWITEH